MRRKDQPYSIYKDHFACFKCRKAFKQPNAVDLPKEERTGKRERRVVGCPQCNEPMHDMGHAFRAPKQDALKEWQTVELLFRNGIRFEYFGWCGPGYRPSTMREVKPFLDRRV